MLTTGLSNTVSQVLCSFACIHHYKMQKNALCQPLFLKNERQSTDIYSIDKL